MLLEGGNVGGIENLADDRQPIFGVRLSEELQGGQAEPLERVRRGARFERAAAQDAGPLALDGLRRLHQLLARLDRARPGNDDEFLADAELGAVDPDPGPFLLVLRACELVWRADG